MAALIVDPLARTIAGLAVPYGPVGRVAGRRWRYQRGSIRSAGPGRVPLLVEHVHALRVGWAEHLVDIPSGLYAVFRVDRGRAGDEALARAAHEWLSVGVDVQQASPDPGEASVRLVRAALLEEISLTRTPVFGGAR